VASFSSSSGTGFQPVVNSLFEHLAEVAIVVGWAYSPNALSVAAAEMVGEYAHPTMP
jgi:hypothetical protein